MRDVLVYGLVLLGALLALRRPWLGVMLWTWLSIMSPHRYTWGFAYDAPLAAIAAGSTMLGFLFTRDKRESPFKGAPPVILLFFMIWVTASWLLGLNWQDDQPQWEKVMKIDFMILVALAVLHSKKHIVALICVCAASLAVLGAKGGLFTILNAGSYHVYGPPGSFIADNNHFALALVMTIPLLRFLQMQLSGRLARHGMTVAMVLLAAAALGSQSRGALVAITAMSLFLWWRGRSKLMGGIFIAGVAVSLIAFMPDQWSDRMSTINTFEEDDSAMGRIAAWWVAWGIAKDYFFGVGFNASHQYLFDMYSPIVMGRSPAAHSIYFQILGNHGFVGLGLYLALWVSTYRWAARIRKEAKGISEARWCVDLAGMCQVSLAGFAVGGAFLSMAYFDLPYNIMVLVVLTRLWMLRRAWQHEPGEPTGRPTQAVTNLSSAAAVR